MVLKKLATTIILLATFTVPEFVRIRRDKVEEAPDAMDAQGWEDGATSAVDDAEIDSASPPVTALESSAAPVQEPFLQGSVFSPAFNFTVRKQVGVVPNQPSSAFSKTLDYVKRADGWDRRVILMAACESSAFSCGEIIQFVKFSSDLPWEVWSWEMSRRWLLFAMLFVEGRNHKGCISDPVDAKSIVDSFESRWRETEWPSVAVGHSFDFELGRVKNVFIDNDSLRPAKNVWSPPMQVQTGLRTDKDMTKLVGDMKELLLIKFFTFPGYGPGIWIASNFTNWLKQIRSNGEQFSGPQLVTLTHAISDSILEVGTTQAISLLLQYLEQYVTGVTCREVNQILERMVKPHAEPYFFAGLYALKPNIVDGQNKVAIVAATGLLEGLEYTDLATIEMVLRDVGVGLPPKNNPIFGVVEGNPVIFVLDASTTMDARFTLGIETFTRRKFCYSQLEMVLEGLPNGTYFNVIRYSSSAVKLFQKPVLVSKANIDKAMEPVSWRGGYTPGQDPSEMLREIKVFALEFKHQLNRSTEKNAMEALKLAYGTAESPSQQTGSRQQTLLDHEALTVDKNIKNIPQIYFLTSGLPDGGSRQILDKIDEFDSGRNIPVHSIAWIVPTDTEAKQFVKDLANKTGGFFRPIEQAS